LVAGESRVYYLLGFHPRADRKTGDWRKLEVDVTRPGVTVRTRRGYTLRPASGKGRNPPDPSGAAPAAVTAALDSTRQQEGIPLRAKAFVFEPRPKNRARVLVAAEFDARGLPFEGDGTARASRLTSSVAVTHRDTGVTQEFHEQIAVRAGAGEVPGWRSMARELVLDAGVAQARIVLHHPASGLVGAVTHRFEVPADALRLTTPILTDRIERAGENDAHPRAAIVVKRVFPPRGPLYCEFEVFGAKDGPGRAPSVVAGVEVQDADGKTVRSAAPTRVTPDGRGRLLRLIGIGMDGLPEGEYRMVLRVRDEIAGTDIERVETFALRGSAE
jgi:hypothetical protein